MSVISEELGEPHRTEAAPSPHRQPVSESVPPVLITEQQVLFASAASIAVPAEAPPRINPIRLAVNALRELIGPQPRAARPHHPARSRSYYDTSLSGRERFRL
ncbi:hypothetical protein BH09ACT7_BH09ACT7_15840 [soil metagenome]